MYYVPMDGNIASENVCLEKTFHTIVFWFVKLYTCVDLTYININNRLILGIQHYRWEFYRINWTGNYDSQLVNGQNDVALVAVNPIVNFA